MEDVIVDLTNFIEFGEKPTEIVWLPFYGYLICRQGHKGRKFQAGDSLSLVSDLTCEVCGELLYYFVEAKAGRG